MILYPAIDLRHGKVVQLVGGDPAKVAIELPSPEEQFETWTEAGATWIHIVDLDAALGERNQWHVLARLLGRGIRVQFGGGVRSMTQVQQLLDLGVDRVVIGTQGVLNPLWLREVCRIFPQKVVLAVDARGRDIVVKGWTETTGNDVVEFARSLDDAGLAGFLFTNVEREGRLAGIEREVVRDLLRNIKATPLQVSGGVTTIDEVAWLKESGAAGVVLGMSIYTGGIDLKAAIARHPQPARHRALVLDTEPELGGEDADGDGSDVLRMRVLRSREGLGLEADEVGGEPDEDST